MWRKFPLQVSVLRKEEIGLKRAGEAEQTKGKWDKNRALWHPPPKKKQKQRDGETIINVGPKPLNHSSHQECSSTSFTTIAK